MNTPHETFTHMTDDQYGDLLDLMSAATCLYDEDILESPEAYAASGIDAAEAETFAYIDELLADRDAQIAALTTELEAARALAVTPAIIDAYRNLKASGVHPTFNISAQFHWGERLRDLTDSLFDKILEAHS